jgi:biopolymer transport protein ExbD
MASVGNGQTISLNIMPMLDVFSILILFLLMSFSTEPVSYDVSEGVELPVSNTLSSLEEVPSVRITKTRIIINDKSVVSLRGSHIVGFDKSQGTVLPLFRELEKLAKANKKVRSKNNSEPMELTLEVDKNHEFKLIKQVMKSAQQADFIKFNLMVEKES